MDSGPRRSFKYEFKKLGGLSYTNHCMGVTS